MTCDDYKHEIAENGFTILPDIYTADEIGAIFDLIKEADHANPNFRKTASLFAIRQFFKEIPEAAPVVLTAKLKALLKDLFGEAFFVVKSIYFDKPEGSNWFVAYHQDLTISVDRKADIDGYGPWTIKQNQFATQPPPDVLKSIFTVRIHLDDADAHNGALRVIPGSHHEICRTENVSDIAGHEIICNVPRGGIMIMKPLLLHASRRSTNDNKRRVIHIEFSDRSLPPPLSWAEQLAF
ncbi:MAG: phytanoyl-CoA dioxygenase family protein [Bacteroidota bacterium]